MPHLKEWIYRTLDRPGGRWLVCLRGSLNASRRNRQLCRIRYDRQWIHTYREGVIVDVWVNGGSPRVYDAKTADVCCFDYTPRPGDTVVDVGAGIGTETLSFARQVGPAGRVLAIEAHPAVFGCLARMCRLNGLAHVVPVACAASDAPGELFMTDLDRHISNTVLDGNGAGVAVPARTLDDLCAEHGIATIDLLKMNIEGAETAALRGARRMLPRTRHVCISCHDFKAAATGIDAMRTKRAVCELLRGHGFELRLRENDPRPWARDWVYGASRA
jgi:FkbM family methyltransferase